MNSFNIFLDNQSSLATITKPKYGKEFSYGDVTIIVDQTINGYKACLSYEPGIWAVGGSKSMAIGNLWIKISENS